MAITMSAMPHTDYGPCPRVDLTISGLPSGLTTVNLWRMCEGAKHAVRGGRHRSVAGSDFLTDFEVPLGRDVTYQLEILDGPSMGTFPATLTISVTPTRGCIQDPLVATSAVPVSLLHKAADGSPILQLSAMQSLEYAAGSNTAGVIGSNLPVALLGQRMAASNVDFSMLTDAVDQTNDMRDLLSRAGTVLVRPLPAWGEYLPALCYLSVTKPVERPITANIGETATAWELSGSLVQAPTMKIVIPLWTYGQVESLYSTYNEAKTHYGSKKYLNVLADPG